MPRGGVSVHGFWLAFGMVFLAELGDKTQVATMMLSAHGHRPAAVFVGAAVALVLVALLSTLLGDALGHALPVRWIRAGAGLLFMVLGALLLTGRT